jgi:hypothetical protein
MFGGEQTDSSRNQDLFSTYGRRRLGKHPDDRVVTFMKSPQRGQCHIRAAGKEDLHLSEPIHHATLRLLGTRKLVKVTGVVHNNTNSVWHSSSLPRDVAKVHRSKLTRDTITHRVGEPHDYSRNAVTKSHRTQDVDGFF